MCNSQVFIPTKSWDYINKPFLIKTNLTKHIVIMLDIYLIDLNLITFSTLFAVFLLNNMWFVSM